MQSFLWTYPVISRNFHLYSVNSSFHEVATEEGFKVGESSPSLYIKGQEMR
jgi:hypothetical protein